MTSAGTHWVLRGPRGFCSGSRLLRILPLPTPRTLGLVPRPLLSQLPFAFAVPRGAQLYLHRCQLLPQLCIHQQEALQLLLQLGAEQTMGLVGGVQRGRGSPAPPHRPAPSPRPALTASVSWLRWSRSRLCALSSSRCLSVTSLSCCSRARSSEEGVFLVAA